MGPPSKDMACATIENEHSTTQERVSCNKLYPRKCIDRGKEEIAEDPRRRALYRLWLSRNCHFINNYVPIVLLAMLSNMDFQATLTKEAVIEYMTKYMTKSGQASLFKVMENSFSLCIEKARENMQGSGSAVLRWFNLQSITEVKSQLETMHLIFKVPRYISTRDFGDLRLRTEFRATKTKEQIKKAEDQDDLLSQPSYAEKYCARGQWELPCTDSLLARRPSSSLPLWRDILKTVGKPVLDGELLETHYATVADSWPEYLELLSLWQLKRYFTRVQNTVRCKPRAVVVTVHPTPHFKVAKEHSQWIDACKWLLLGYCNHGQCCTNTFKDYDELMSFPDDRLEELADRFINTKDAERLASKFATCPPHARRDWQLGMGRKQRAKERQHSPETVIKSLSKVQYVGTKKVNGDGIAWGSLWNGCGYMATDTYLHSCGAHDISLQGHRPTFISHPFPFHTLSFQSF